MATLKECSTLLTDGDWIESKDQSEAGIRLIQTGNVGNGEYLDKSERAKYISEETFNRIGCTEVFPGDILISRLPDPVGRACIIPQRDEKMIAAVDCSILRTDNRIVNSKYLLYFLGSPYYFNQLTTKLAGTTRVRISRKNLEMISVIIPAKNVQEHIINQFDCVMNLIRARKRQLEELDMLIKARFVEMFGNIHENRFPKCKLRDIAHIKHGFAFSGEFFSDIDNGIVLVTPGNFAIGGGFQEIRNRYFISDYPEEYVLHAGDLIVTMTDLSKKADTLGYGAIVPSTGKIYLHNQRIGLFDKLDDHMDRVFMRWFMQTEEYRKEIVRTSTGSTVHHTSPDRILDSEIIIPPIEEQMVFRRFAEQIDKSKAVVQQALAKDQLLFDSLMQQYFG